MPDIDPEEALDAWVDDFIRFGREQGPFDLDEHNRPIIRALVAYTTESPLFAGMPCIINGPGDLRRGIALVGNVGTGKTYLASVWAKWCRNVSRGFQETSARSVAREFMQRDFEGIEKYGEWSYATKQTTSGSRSKGRPLTWLFDDMGNELPVNRFGNKVDVMAEVLQDRYDGFVRDGMRTHITSNLSRAQIGEMYGPRIADRCGQMFNFILVPGASRRPGQLGGNS